MKRLPWLALLGTAVLALCVGVLGLPAALALLGVVALRCAGSRLLALGAAGAWAAAVLLETAVLLAALLVAGLLLPGALGGPAATLVLLTPLIAAALSYAVRVPAREPDRAQTWLDPTVAGITSGVLVVAWWIGRRAPGAHLSWAMSGDARNHVLLLRSVLASGGVTREQLLAYPITSDGIAAVIAAPGRAGLLPGSLLAHDITAIASTYVLLFIALAVLFAAGVAASARTTGSGAALPLVTVLASGLSLTSLVTGTALQDGFFSAYLGLVVLVAAVVLGLAMSRDRTSPPGALLVLAAAAPLLLTVWSVLAVLVVPPVVLLALGGRGGRRERLVAVVVVLAVPATLLVKHAQLAATFVLPGGVTRPHEGLLAVLVLGCAAVATLAADTSLRGQALLLLSGLAAGVVILAALAVVGPGPAQWQYYGSKTLWLVTSAFLWLLAAPAAHLAARPAAGGRSAAVTSAVGVLALAAACYPLADMATSLTSPVERAKAGWSQPAAVSLDGLQRFGDQGNPYVFWHWSDSSTYSGEDRIDTFWSIAAWATPRTPYPIDPIRWGYESTGELQQLCALADAVPDLRVVTRDPLLPDQLQRECAGTTPTTLLDG